MEKNIKSSDNVCSILKVRSVIPIYNKGVLDSIHINIKESKSKTSTFEIVHSLDKVRVSKDELLNLNLSEFDKRGSCYYVTNENFKGCTSYPAKKNKKVQSEPKAYISIKSSPNVVGVKSSTRYKKSVRSRTLTYPLSWDDVIFKNGYLMLCSPFANEGGLGKKIKWDSCLPEFEKIKPYLSRKRLCVNVKIEDGDIVEVLNFSDIIKYINNLNLRVKSNSDVVIRKPNVSVSSKPISMFVEHARTLIEIKSSKYLRTLCQLHTNTTAVFYCTETKNTTTMSESPEKAFIFCLKDTRNKLLLIYENVNDNRSSYLFWIARSSYSNTIKKIHKYFSSTTENKRSKMLGGTNLGIPKLICYYRIVHSSYNQWERDINERIRVLQ